jgi:hypothetical protein
VHWSSSTEAPLLLPPGQYDVYWNQDLAHEHHPMLLARGVTVQPGQQVKVSATSGLQLERAAWVPKVEPSNGWWGAVPAGEAPAKRVHWSSSTEAPLLLPPGQYDVYWNQDLAHENHPMLLARGVTVQPGQQAKIEAKSGMKLKVPASTPPLDWWGIVPPGKGPDDRLHWSNSFNDPLLVPPGTYDIFWKQNFSEQPEKIKQGVTVMANQLLEVDVIPPSAPQRKSTGAGQYR